MNFSLLVCGNNCEGQRTLSGDMYIDSLGISGCRFNRIFKSLKNLSDSNSLKEHGTDRLPTYIFEHFVDKLLWGFLKMNTKLLYIPHNDP